MHGTTTNWIRGMSKQAFLAKAASKLRIAEYAVEQNDYESAASLLYFSLFHAMQFVVGVPPSGSWKHVAIAKVFNAQCFRQQIFPSDMLAAIYRMYDELYALRKQSDYSEEVFSDDSKQKIEQYIYLLHEVLSCLQPH
jgi:uncharacterized protein (UPF0332 family)